MKQTQGENGTSSNCIMFLLRTKMFVIKVRICEQIKKYFKYNFITWYERRPTHAHITILARCPPLSLHKYHRRILFTYSTVFSVHHGQHMTYRTLILMCCSSNITTGYKSVQSYSLFPWVARFPGLPVRRQKQKTNKLVLSIYLALHIMFFALVKLLIVYRTTPC